MELSDREQLILKELIKDSRSSDTQIANKTKIPLKTVNRIRRQLENENKVQYFTRVQNNDPMYLLTITFKPGINKEIYLDKFHERHWMYSLTAKYVTFESLGQSDMKLALVILITANPKERLKFFNDHVISSLRDALGQDCIDSIKEVEMTSLIRLFKNYMPNYNYDKARIKPDWPDDHIHL
ncbi:winged helix-turn-helix domain-containing protein [Candidatus Woesearchaeota archaeon]|nr:winged helix-turn-helix domain-containing protein [Candidatus Woesearchaeota archaeon]